MIPSLQALKYLTKMLGKSCPEIISARQVNTQEPENTAQLPHLTLSAAAIKESPVGIGGGVTTLFSKRRTPAGFSTYKAAMTFRLDIWADSAAKLEDITGRITQSICDRKLELRSAGFLILRIASIGEILPVEIRDKRESRTGVFKRRLEYNGIYEQSIKLPAGKG